MAAEFVASAAANTVRNLATEYTSPYISYFFHFDRIVGDFKNQLKELELKKDRVKNDVNEAIRQTEVIEKDVEDWLTRVEKELGEAQSLAEEIECNKCSNIWCPNWGWRCCLSKKVTKKTLIINKLLETCNFQRVGYRSPLQGIELITPSKDFKPSKSSNSAFSEIIKALNSDGVKMIGLYGMPGVGKTTLAKEVLKHAKQKHFDVVVMVTMSQTPNIKNIQDKIAFILGLKFQSNTEEGRAEELLNRLNNVKKILIIIDDVWEEFKLETIGIPFNDEHEGCKILLTTRLQQVCTRMNCQEKIQLNIFSEDEAWALLNDTAGLQDVSSPLKEVARDVCHECQGLPLAVVTMGKALKGEGLDGWRAANQRLKDSRHLDNLDVCGGIYNCLKLSYDYLKEDNIRSCFLLCSLFPEDYDISIEMLTICGIGQGLFCTVYKFEELRREICLTL